MTTCRRPLPGGRDRFAGPRLAGWTGAVLLLAAAGPAAAEPDDLERIRADIANEGLEWTAGETRIWRMSPAERRRYVVPDGAVPVPPELLSGRSGERPATPSRGVLETRVDWRERYGFHWITPPRDQGDCGSCWAFATVGVVENLAAWRHSLSDPTLDLSEQHLLDCAWASLGCGSGGITWGPPGWFVRDTGLVPEYCYPYVSGDTGERGRCLDMAALAPDCAAQAVHAEVLEILSTNPPGLPWDPDPYVMDEESATEIKTLLAERPVGVSMRVFSDFYAYERGVYAPTAGATDDGMHAVLLVGYDDASGYWIVKNSWGDDFGESGFFRIRYGTSSVGMFAFTYRYREDATDPAFCDDFPAVLTLDGNHPAEALDLRIANCGAGVLTWDATLPDWAEIRDAYGMVSANWESSAGRTYRVGVTRRVGGGMTGEIALTGAPNGPVVVALETIDVPDPPEPDAGTDAADDAVGDAGPDAGDPAERTPDGGCDCAAPGGGRSGGLGALFLLGLLVFRRSTRLKAQARRGPTPSAVHHPS